VTIKTKAGQTYKLVGVNGKDKVFASLDSKDNEVLIYSQSEVDELLETGAFTIIETKTDSYLKHLEKQYHEATAEFEEVKLKVIAEAQNITVHLATDFGGAYVTKVDGLTLAGAKVKLLSEQIRIYKYHMN